MPESAVSPPLESSAAEAEQLLPLEPSAPDGLMTSEELALLNKILVTDDMTPEGKVDIFEFLTFSAFFFMLDELAFDLKQREKHTFLRKRTGKQKYLLSLNRVVTGAEDPGRESLRDGENAL